MEMPPTSASLVGSNTMPDPSMLTAVNIVSWPTLIFLATDIPLPYLKEVRRFSYSKGFLLIKKSRSLVAGDKPPLLGLVIFMKD
jgi:hypothetical protein